MMRETLINKTFKSLSKLPNEKVREFSYFTEYIPVCSIYVRFLHTQLSLHITFTNKAKRTHSLTLEKFSIEYPLTVRYSDEITV